MIKIYCRARSQVEKVGARPRQNGSESCVSCMFICDCVLWGACAQLWFYVSLWKNASSTCSDVLIKHRWICGVAISNLMPVVCCEIINKAYFLSLSVPLGLEKLEQGNKKPGSKL